MTDQAASTNGWDTVYGIPITDVNAVIAAMGSSPSSFSQQDSEALGSFTISGSFSAWQIVQGGAGTLLHLETPIPSLTFTPTSGSAPSKVFTNGNVVAEIDLQYLPSSATPPPGSSGDFHDLKLKSMVSIVSSSFAESGYAQYATLVQDAMLKWYNANIDKFSHVFATVNLNRTAAQGQFAWLLPTSCSYSYVDVIGDAVGILGILCMTGGRTAPSNQQLSPNVIPANSHMGFLISSDRLMQDLLLPAMPQSFAGTTSGDYQLSSDFKTITLINTDVALQLPQSSDYTPYLESLTVSIFSDTELQIMSKTKANILDQLCSMGSANQQLYPDQHSDPGDIAIWSYCQTTANFGIQLIALSNGKSSLNFVAIGTPQKENWTEQSEGMKILEDILEAIAVLVVLVLGVLTDGAAFIIGAMVIGILTSLVTTALPKLIATLGTDDAPSIDLLVINATDPIQWPSGTGFNINSAALNGALQLGGKPPTGAADVETRMYEAALDKAHEHKRGAALLDAPVSALAGVSERHAAALAAIGIRTIRQLAENRFVLLAQQLVTHNKGQ